MDERFLEFWGNLMLNAAQGKKQTDALFRRIQQSFFPFAAPPPRSEREKGEADDLWAMFRKFYGLDRFSEQSTEYKHQSQKAMEEFQRSFKEYLNMMGMVPKDEHLKLVEKYEALKEQCAQQEETLHHLKMLLKAKDGGQGEILSSFDSLLKNQRELFQNMMQGMGRGFSEATASRSDSGQTDPEPEEGEPES